MWLEAGSGTFANLQRCCPLDEVDAVICSHEHPDHWSDIDSFAVAAAHSTRRSAVPVYAPRGVRRRSYHAEDPIFVWHDVGDGDEVTIGALRWRFVETGHGPPTLAVRATSGSSVLAYSADCPPGWSFETLGSGIGTGLCEATFTARHEGSAAHLSGRQAGAMAKAAGVHRLVVTHRWPTVSAQALATEAEEAFGGPVIQASIGQSWEW